MSEWVPADPFSIAGTCDDQDHTLPALEEDLVRTCGMNAIAERDNLVVVYPGQTTEATPCDVGTGSIQITKRARPENPLSQPLLSSKLCHHIILIPIVFTWQVFRRGSNGGCNGRATYPELFMAIGVVAGIEFAAATTAVAGLGAITMGGPEPRTGGLSPSRR